MTTNQTLSVAMVAMLSLTLITAPVAAKPPAKKTADELRLEDARKLSEEGKLAFKNGEYIKAAAAFMLAYSKSNEPATLFNAARAYQKANMFKEAIALFEEYAARPDVKDEEGKAEARIYAKTMHEALEPRKAPPPDMPKTVPPPLIVTTTVAEPPPRPGRTLTWTLIGGGSLLAIGGIGGFVAGNFQINEANTSTNWAAPDAETTYHDNVAGAKNLRTASTIGAGVGLGIVGYGLYRLFTEPMDADSTPTKMPTVTPNIDKNGAALAARWEW